MGKEYSGVATAAVCGLVQYTEQLKKDNYTIKGEEMTAMRASAAVDNPGAWKALAKADFDLTAVRMYDYGADVRFRLEHGLQ